MALRAHGLSAWLWGLLLSAEVAHAQVGQEAGLPLAPTAEAREMQQHYYERLHRDPWRALGWEALLPGAGGFYNGIRLHAIVTLSVSLIGAGLWTAGAAFERDGMWWAGAGTFTVGRVGGLISAPIGAVRLNLAFRRHLGIAANF